MSLINNRQIADPLRQALCPGRFDANQALRCQQCLFGDGSEGRGQQSPSVRRIQKDQIEGLLVGQPGQQGWSAAAKQGKVVGQSAVVGIPANQGASLGILFDEHGAGRASAQRLQGQGPVPANASRTFNPARLPRRLVRMLNRASRTRSAVGRMPVPAKDPSFLPLAEPLIILTGINLRS
jgi:hypothetical protein